MCHSSVKPCSFQCSSASRKFLNFLFFALVSQRVNCFSALQRAENSSIDTIVPIGTSSIEFQCSSASRKFLNSQYSPFVLGIVDRFSALQRAENSSIHYQDGLTFGDLAVSVLFSEPKIPQFNRFPSMTARDHRVSVLFSEPKIPQFALRL